MKIVINRCYGGFGISRKAWEMLKELGAEGMEDEPDFGEAWSDGSIRERVGCSSFDHTFYVMDVPRNDPTLVAVVEQLGDAANGSCARLAVVEIPDDVEWEIKEHDGSEHIAEKHRTWG